MASPTCVLPKITNPYTPEFMVAHATQLSMRVQLLISNDRQHITKTHRDMLALAYWTMLFEYHNGLLTLVRNNNLTSAFAMLRIFEEAFLKMYLVMFGSDNQVQAIWTNKYGTDFAAVGEMIDKKIGNVPLWGPKLKDQIKTLHGFTHSGTQQIVRQLTKLEDGNSTVAPNYDDGHVRLLVVETMPMIFMAGAFITEFLGYPDEHKSAIGMFNDFLDAQVASLQLDELIANPPGGTTA
jgi:hypothetical protein